MNIKQVLNQKATEINHTLKEIMNIEDSTSEKLLESMKYTLLSGGKRIRPVLTVLVAELLNGDIEAARRAGAAIELIHTYSLIHDDLPSMDNDKYRRGKLTNHKVYGPGIAILAGDELLTYAFQILSSLDLASEKVIKIINIVSETAGLNGMVGGQVLDLEAEDKSLALDELKEIHRAKTGALFKSSILAGAYCSSPTDKEVDSLLTYAENLGLTFQIVDDILDVIGDEDKLGKSTGRDQKLNKTTYPGLLGLSSAKKEAELAVRKAQESLLIFGKKGKILSELVEYILTRES